MPHHAIATIPVSGHTCSSCHQMEHRGLNLTTSSPSFRIPSAHIIFIPSPGTSAPGTSMCILCNIAVSRDAQESHLSGKRHARIMKHTRGPRACTCPAPVPMPAPRPEVPVAKRRLRIFSGRVNRRRIPRHKKKRCGQRSYVAGLMKIGRAGLFPKYVRDSEYRVRPFQSQTSKAFRILAANLSSPDELHTPRRRATFLFDGIHLSEQFFALLNTPGTHASISWSNALPYFGRYIRRTLALPQRLALGWPGLRWPRKALVAPALATTQKQGRESSTKQKSGAQKDVRKVSVQKSGAKKTIPKIVRAPKTGAWRSASAQEADAQKTSVRRASTRKVGIKKADAQKTGTRNVSKQKVGTRTADSVQPAQGPKTKTKTKTKKKPQQQWHCDVCDRSMAPGSMEDHLQGMRHVRKAAKAPPKVKAPAPVSQKQGLRGAKGIHVVENIASRSS